MLGLPSVPCLYPLFEQIKMFLICHCALPSSLRIFGHLTSVCVLHSRRVGYIIRFTVWYAHNLYSRRSYLQCYRDKTVVPRGHAFSHNLDLTQVDTPLKKE